VSSTSNSAPGLAREQATGLANSASDRATDVAGHARAAGSETTAAAGRNVAKVKDETVSQARDLMEQARSQVTEQANSQLGQLGSAMRRLASELEEMSRRSDQDGMARSVVDDAAQRVHRTADMVEGRDVSDVLDDVRRFARRSPAAFLIGAAGLGMLVGRIGRGVRDADGERQSARSDSTFVSDSGWLDE